MIARRWCPGKFQELSWVLIFKICIPLGREKICLCNLSSPSLCNCLLCECDFADALECFSLHVGRKQRRQDEFSGWRQSGESKEESDESSKIVMRQPGRQQNMECRNKEKIMLFSTLPLCLSLSHLSLSSRFFSSSHRVAASAFTLSFTSLLDSAPDPFWILKKYIFCTRLSFPPLSLSSSFEDSRRHERIKNLKTYKCSMFRKVNSHLTSA